MDDPEALEMTGDLCHMEGCAHHCVRRCDICTVARCQAHLFYGICWPSCELRAQGTVLSIGPLGARVKRDKK